MSPTPDLDRFIQAQAPVYANVLDELSRGKKTSHWMWYIFPQIAGLGASTYARTYAIKDLDEAHRYLNHPVLGARLRECVALVLAVRGHSATDIFGGIDAMKLRSCVTLFAQVSPPASVFHRVLDVFFEGQGDQATIDILEKERGQAGLG